MSSEVRVAKDKYVEFTYQITDLTGEVVERADLPLATIFGRHNRLYDRVEDAMLGMGHGDEVSIELPPESCEWGMPDPQLIFTDSIQNVPPEYHRVGTEVQFQSNNGEAKTFIVTAINADTITFDGNHPFAGKLLTFHVKIVTIRDATGAELVEGVASGVEDLSGGKPETLH